MKQKQFGLKRRQISINTLPIRNTVVPLSAPERLWCGWATLALSSNRTLAAVLPEKGVSTPVDQR